MRELETDPEQLVLQVMDARAYVRAKQRVESAQKPGDIPPGDVMCQAVLRTQVALMAGPEPEDV